MITVNRVLIFWLICCCLAMHYIDDKIIDSCMELGNSQTYCENKLLD